MQDRKIRGSTILAYFKFIKKRWGQDGVDECIRETGVDAKGLSEGAWCDVMDSDRVLNWMERTKGEEYVVACGKFTVKNLGIIGFIVRLASMKMILNRAPVSYGEGFNYGRMTVEYIGDTRARVTFKENTISRSSCLAWRGAFEGMLEMTRTKGAVKELQCQLEGADSCVWDISWS